MAPQGRHCVALQYSGVHERLILDSIDPGIMPRMHPHAIVMPRGSRACSLAMLLAVAACGPEAAGVGGGDAGGGDAGEVPNAGSCVLSAEPRWTSAVEDTVLTAVLTVDPKQALLMLLRDGGFGGSGLRLRDGAVVRGFHKIMGNVDVQWRYSLSRGEAEHLEVRDVVTAAIVRDVAPLVAPAGWTVSSYPALAGDGERVFVVDCWHDLAYESGKSELRAIAVETGASQTITLGTACDQPWGYTPRLIVNVVRDEVVVGGLTDGSIAVANLAAGTAELHPAMFGPPSQTLVGEAHIGTPAFALVGAALDADGARLAVVGPDGRLQLLDASTLAALAPPIDVGLVIANGNTYLPSVESPVAFFGDDRLVHVVVDGEVVVRDLTTGEITATLGWPFEQGDSPWTGFANAPMAALAGAHGLIVAYAAGVAHWPCEGEDPPAEGASLAVTLNGPRTVEVFAPVTFTVESPGPLEPAFRALLLDGMPVIAGIGPALTFTPYEPGVFTLTAIVDDGERAGTAAIELVVSE